MLVSLWIGGLQAAEKTWHLVTAKGEAIELSKVSYLLATSTETFDIVCVNGSTVSGVVSATLEERDPSGIQDIKKGDGQFSQLVGDNLIISGLKKTTQAQVLSLNGALYITQMLDDSQNVINVSKLQAGTYILNVGGTNIKFIKK